MIAFATIFGEGGNLEQLDLKYRFKGYGVSQESI